MKKRRREQMSPEDQEALAVMAAYDLKPGQMLLMGPRSIAVLVGMGDARKLPDTFVINKSEWNGT